MKPNLFLYGRLFVVQQGEFVCLIIIRFQLAGQLPVQFFKAVVLLTQLWQIQHSNGDINTRRQRGGLTTHLCWGFAHQDVQLTSSISSDFCISSSSRDARRYMSSTTDRVLNTRI